MLKKLSIILLVAIATILIIIGITGLFNDRLLWQFASLLGLENDVKRVAIFLPVVLIAIPLALAFVIKFFLQKNKDST